PLPKQKLMKTLLSVRQPLLRVLLFLTSFILSTHGAVVTIPDPGLNAAIREALGIPTAPLTDQDLLGLTFLSAGSRNIQSAEGLEAAHNLKFLDLDSNALSDFV